MLKLNNVNLPIDTDFSDVTALICSKLKIDRSRIISARLCRKSVDARKKSNLHFVCSFEFSAHSEQGLLKRNRSLAACKENGRRITIYDNIAAPAHRPIVIGSGPAGLFSALTLAENGLRPIIFERGSRVEKRINDVEKFFTRRILNTDSNIQFGEGGAGTFSDGKLATGIKDSLIPFVLHTFYENGADEDILYESKPHIGTDKLRTVVKNMREKIISLGGEFHFDCKIKDIEVTNGRVTAVITENDERFDCDTVISAIGHSARDTVDMLYGKDAEIVKKPFAVGVRIEHKQSLINEIQYGEFASSQALGAADYKLAVHPEGCHSLYTFCMCPGGYVVASASEENTVVTNGMSEHARDGENANSALLVSLSPDDFKNMTPLEVIDWQRSLEKQAFKLGGSNYNAPCQTVGDFLDRDNGSKCNVNPTYRPGVTPCDLHGLFPDFICESLEKGLLLMDKRMPGFAGSDAVMTAIESRSSSPVSILRDKVTLQSNIRGLYPCGEGGGHAGGITSSAVDGIKCADAYIKTLIKA